MIWPKIPRKMSKGQILKIPFSLIQFEESKSLSEWKGYRCLKWLWSCSDFNDRKIVPWLKVLQQWVITALLDQGQFPCLLTIQSAWNISTVMYGDNIRSYQGMEMASTDPNLVSQDRLTYYPQGLPFTRSMVTMSGRNFWDQLKDSIAHRRPSQINHAKLITAAR